MRLQDRHVEMAADIFAFDALTINPDRKVTNPNCMFNGTRFALYDHELALVTAGLGVLTPPPWKPGALDILSYGTGEHVLFRGLKGRPVELTRLRKAWAGLSEARFTEYKSTLPQEWNGSEDIVTEALAYLGKLQQHLDLAFEEIRRVLT
jgi:hypothetical protein